jgi:PAS domain S-box-containing protein
VIKAEEILEGIAEGVMACDADLRVTYLNAAAERALGLGRDASLGRPLAQVFPGAMQARGARHVEAFYPPLARWYEVSVHSLHDGGLAFYFRDVTERRAGEARYRLLFDNNPQPCFLVDMQTKRYLDVNEAAVRGYGYTRDEFFGMTVYDLRDPDDATRLRDVIDQPLAELSRLWRHRRKDGSVIDVEVAAQEFDLDGRPVRLLVVDDVTERLAAERRLRLVSDHLPVLIAYMDREGCFRFANRTYREWFGREVVGSHLRDVIGEANYTERQPYLEAVLRGERTRFETIVDSNLGRRDCEVLYIPDADPAGEVRGFYVMVTDISERKRAEAVLRDADRRKDEFLATLAHELRNPLAPIRHGLELLRLADGKGEAAAQAREMMERQLGQMVRLIDDLLDVSRVTRGAVELRREPVALGAIVAAAVETSRPLLDAAGHRFSLSLPAEPVTLDVDPVRIAQVISNLLNNAAKYTEPGGTIALRAWREGNEAVIQVSDDGIGIPAEMLPRVFQMFAQVNRGLNRPQGGLGIGLALARTLVEMHGGRIAAASAGPGTGSTFTVRLPAARSPEPQVAAAHATRAARKTLDILVVDDNVDAARSLALLLGMVGHRVRVAHEGNAALAAVQVSRPQVVLLDIGMPGMDGYEVARRMRAMAGGDALRLIALTGHGQPEDRQQARAAGFDQHLVKPVTLEALTAVLDREPS